MTLLDHIEPIEGLSPDVENLSLMLAKIITSKHNQHALVRIVGKAGKGKSWTGLSLSYGVAVEVANILGGNPSDYFTMKKDLGVISKSEIKRVMTNPDPYTIKYLDDVAVAWNARKYKDEFNIDLNDLIQTFRPNHNLVIMTLQSGFLIDKVPRSLIHYQLEMVDNIFDYGVSTVKTFELELNEDNGKIYRHYLRGNGGTYVRHLIYAPPKEITDAYEIERAIQLKRMNEEKEKIAKAKQPKERDLKKNLIPFIDGMMVEFGLTQKRACEFFGVTPKYYQSIKANERITIT